MNSTQAKTLSDRINRKFTLAERKKIISQIKVDEDSGKSLLEAVACCSVTLLRSSDLMEALNRSFSVIGRTADVDRIYYFENSLDSKSDEILTSQRIEWAKEQIEPQIDNPDLQAIPLKIFSGLLETLKNGDPYSAIVSKIQDTPLRQLLQQQQIATVLMLPLMVNNRFHGFIGFDDCINERDWTVSELSALQILTTHVSHLIEKNEAKELVRRTYRHARIGTWSLDLKNDDYYLSPILKEIFEIPVNSNIDRDDIKCRFLSESDHEMMDAAIANAIKTGQPYTIEFPIKTHKGESKWIRDTGSVEYKNGKPVRVFGTVQDIDEKKRAEIESERNKKLLHAITDQAQVAIVVRDSEGKHLFVNRQWKKIFGMQKRDVTGKSLHELFDRSIADSVSAKDRSVIESNRQMHFEERIFSAEGIRYHMVNKFPILGIPGVKKAIGAISTDISEMKETEARLQTAEQKLRDVVEHSTNLFYSHDADHNMVYVSPQAHHFFGCDPEKAKIKWTEFLTDHPMNSQGVETTERAIRTGTAQPAYQLQLRKTTGEIIWVEVNEAPLVRDGKTVLITGSLTDITDRKKAEIETRNSLKEKETLLAEIHHRVKNNLAVVASMMQLQAMESDSPELQGQLIQSVMRIKSMANIHEHLYRNETFSRLDFGANLESLVNDIIGTMQYSTKISLRFFCDNTFLNINQAIPASLIVNEVITNIIKHGFKDLEKGEITVKLKSSGGYTELEIEDDGHGFPDSFDPESTSTLGMQLIKTLTYQIRGEYSYQNLQSGLRFRITFKTEE